MAEPEPEQIGPTDDSAQNGPSFRKKREVPDGLWLRCPGCEGMLYRKRLEENLRVCPDCKHHFRLGARSRIGQLTDPDSFEELFGQIAPADPLEFEWAGKTYVDRIRQEQEKTGNIEAIITGVAYIRGRRVALGVMDGEWLIGSMGSVVGEKTTLLIEEATASSLPLVMVCCSGGARMHEGALSLMQMGKTSAAVARFDDAGGFYIAILADPTTGGTLASFAMLADITIAEPGALIGFAGTRVAATVKTELPEGFQRAEFLLDHGFVDRIVPRDELRSEIVHLLDYVSG